MRLLALLAGSLALLGGLLAACATSSESGGAGVAYVARGSGAAPLEALAAAKVAAVYLAAVDLIGEAGAQAAKGRIEAAVRGAENPNAYVYNATLEILHSGGEPLTYEIRIRVNVDALEATLRSLGLIAAGSAGSAGGPVPAGGLRAADGAGGPAAGAAATPSAAAPPGGETLSPQLRAQIERELDRMTYMVSIAEGSGLDRMLQRSATTSAEAYLADNRIPYVDSAQVEALRKDQELLYEQETGKSVGVTQWIAQRLHADVYIVVDAATSSSSRDGRYYGSAEVALRIFETSTASGLGAANYASLQPSVSLVSEREAVGNALSSSVYRAMGAAVKQARSYLLADLAAGIGYDLLIINTPDDRLMRAFMATLAPTVRDVRLLSWSREQTRYRVTVSGSAADLEGLVYAAARSHPELGSMGLVTLRGRELVFDAGR